MDFSSFVPLILAAVSTGSKLYTSNQQKNEENKQYANEDVNAFRSAIARSLGINSAIRPYSSVRPGSTVGADILGGAAQAAQSLPWGRMGGGSGGGGNYFSSPSFESND